MAYQPQDNLTGREDEALAGSVDSLLEGVAATDAVEGTAHGGVDRIQRPALASSATSTSNSRCTVAQQGSGHFSSGLKQPPVSDSSDVTIRSSMEELLYKLKQGVKKRCDTRKSGDEQVMD